MCKQTVRRKRGRVMKELIRRSDAIKAFCMDCKGQGEPCEHSDTCKTMKVLRSRKKIPTVEPKAESIIDTYGTWTPCEERLPNEDEIPYDGISRKGERCVSNRVFMINTDGFIYTGVFINSSHKPRHGKRYEVGEHYNMDSEQWIVPLIPKLQNPVAWMPLPKPYERSE